MELSFVRWALPAAAIFLPVAFFLSVMPDRNQAERIDLSGICRRGSPGSWAGDARCGPNTKVKQTNL